MRAEWPAILRDIALLREADPGLRIPGADTHRYVLNPVLSESQVGSFEAEHRISLPCDYREFLLSIGNGGAGPAYGVERLGQSEGRDWTEIPGLVGDLAQPFPYTGFWNVGPADDSLTIEEQYQQQDDYWSPRHVCGSFPICHYGCAQRACLIVTGPERGNIWCDDRADWSGLYPEMRDGRSRSSFFDWYRSWLDASLRKCNSKAP